MDQEFMIKRMQDPFPYKDVEWKIQVATQDKTRGMAVAYLNSRAIQTRLDEKIGPCNWKNTYLPWQNNAQLCGLSIYDKERGEWVTKYDGAENTDIEPIKGGLSDSFKRAACVWGIGRYLYQLPSIWVEIEQEGKSIVIKENQYNKLEAEYNNAIRMIFYNAGNNQGKVPVAPTKQDIPSISTADTALPTVLAASSEYWVKSVNPSGKESQLIELINPDGEITSAYIKKSESPIKLGSKLTGVAIEKKDHKNGPYLMITDYKIAA
jgi:hypothetical protein